MTALTKPLDVMIDIETLGRSPGCGILSIGATRLDYDNRNSRDHFDPANHLYIVINNFDVGNHGFMTDNDTMRWWKKQKIWPQVARDVLESKTGVAEACKLLADYISAGDPLAKVWCNSPTFDIEILKTAYRKVGVKFPVSYRAEADFRTIMETAYPERSERPGRPPEVADFLPHHALGDAMAQADSLLKALDRLNAPKRYAARPEDSYGTERAAGSRPGL